MIPDDAFFTPTKHMEALDQHLHLIECLKRPVQAQSWDDMLDSVGGAFQYQTQRGFESISPGGVAAAIEAVRLGSAATYWVAPQVLDLITSNMALLPEDSRLHPFDLVTQRGFAWLDYPIELLDSKGAICTVRAISWGIGESEVRAKVEGTDKLGRAPALVVTVYSDLLEPGADEVYGQWDEEDRRRASSHLGRLQVLAQNVMPWNLPVKDEGDESISMPVAFGIEKNWDPRVDVPVDPTLTLDLVGSGNMLGRWLQSFFLVIGERLISKVRPSRQIRRRMERKKVPEWGDVRVVDLRRYTDAGKPRDRGDQDEGWWVDWTHRHRVKAHWRRCWVKVEGLDEKVPVWRPVKTYLRGPDHLPVIERDDVFRAVR